MGTKSIAGGGGVVTRENARDMLSAGRSAMREIDMAVLNLADMRRRMEDHRNFPDGSPQATLGAPFRGSMEALAHHLSRAAPLVERLGGIGGVGTRRARQLRSLVDSLDRLAGGRPRTLGLSPAEASRRLTRYYARGARPLIRRANRMLFRTETPGSMGTVRGLVLRRMAAARRASRGRT